MKSLFDTTEAMEITRRIEELTPMASAQWGKMNVNQMMAHCSGSLELYFSTNNIQRPLIGILFGSIAKKRMLTNKPWSRNLPTAKELKPTITAGFEAEKERLIQRIGQFVTKGVNQPHISHPFFGKMSNSEWGLLLYKHLDHHLTQFSV